MKLSIFTTQTRALERGDNIKDALRCYNDLADEVVVVDGEETWPQEFSWKCIAEHFQRGYDRSTGDWVIHMDLDFIFHPNDFVKIRDFLNRNSSWPAVSFLKYQFIMPDRYNIKSRLVLAVNKKRFGNRIKFDGGGTGDLCQPSFDGIYIKPNDALESKMAFYNYEKLWKTKEQIKQDCGRMDRAYYREFGVYQLGDGTDESAYDGWIKMVLGRYAKPAKEIQLDQHPIYVQEAIKNLREDQWGYSGFGLIGGNNYVQSVNHSR